MKLNKKLMASAAAAVCVSVTMTSMAFAQGYTKKTFSEDFEQTADADKFNDGYINQDDVIDIIKINRAGIISAEKFESSEFSKAKKNTWLTIGENSKGKWSLFSNWNKQDDTNSRILALACINNKIMTNEDEKIDSTNYVFSGWSPSRQQPQDGYIEGKTLHIAAAEKGTAYVKLQVKKAENEFEEPKDIKKLSFNLKKDKPMGVYLYPDSVPQGDKGSYIKIGFTGEHKVYLKSVKNGVSDTVTGPQVAWNAKCHMEIEVDNNTIKLIVKNEKGDTLSYTDNGENKTDMQLIVDNLSDLMSKSENSIVFFSECTTSEFSSPVVYIDNVNIEYFDGDEPGYQIDNTNNKIYFNLKPSELNSSAAAGTKDHVLYATYDESKLVDVQIKDVDAVASVIESLEFELNNQTGTKSKFYVWGGSVSDCKPLCAPIPVE